MNRKTTPGDATWKLFKIRGKIVRHALYVTFQPAVDRTVETTNRLAGLGMTV